MLIGLLAPAPDGHRLGLGYQPLKPRPIHADFASVTGCGRPVRAARAGYDTVGTGDGQAWLVLADLENPEPMRSRTRSCRGWSAAYDLGGADGAPTNGKGRHMDTSLFAATISTSSKNTARCFDMGSTSSRDFALGSGFVLLDAEGKGFMVHLSSRRSSGAG